MRAVAHISLRSVHDEPGLPASADADDHLEGAAADRAAPRHPQERARDVREDGRRRRRRVLPRPPPAAPSLEPSGSLPARAARRAEELPEADARLSAPAHGRRERPPHERGGVLAPPADRKSTRLNSS